MSKSKDLDSSFSVKCFRDDLLFYRHAGEVWYDKAGNECCFRENGSLSCKTINNEPSMAIQSERDKCDLNIIKSIYDKTGIMNNVRKDEPKFGDFTSSRDYHDVLLRAQEAQDDFMTLDAHIRARFDNDPGKLLDFVADPKNLTEAVKLGLMKPSDVTPQASQVPQGDTSTPSQ